MLNDEPQRSKTNVEFFRQLVDVAKIRRPFYLAGHSYGGHHLIYTALKYPELVKGLIFLDSSRFSAVDIVENMLQVVVNFQPTGLMSVAIERKLFDYEKAFADFIELSEMQDDQKKAFLAAMMSGTSFLGYTRRRNTQTIPGIRFKKHCVTALLIFPRSWWTLDPHPGGCRRPSSRAMIQASITFPCRARRTNHWLSANITATSLRFTYATSSRGFKMDTTIR